MFVINKAQLWIEILETSRSEKNFSKGFWSEEYINSAIQHGN